MKVYLTGSTAAFIARLLGGRGNQLLESRVPDLSGVWRLKVLESEFGSGRVPSSIEVTLAHQEPYLLYSGRFVDQDGKSIFFDVKTRLDGRPTSSVGATVISRRIDPFTTTSECRYENPPSIETTIMRVSSDCTVLTVKRQAVGVAGTFDCTERYERQMLPTVSPILSESLATDLLKLAAFGTASSGESMMATLDSGVAGRTLVARERPTQGQIAGLEVAAEKSRLSGLPI